MKANGYSMGFALLAATACSQLPETAGGPAPAQPTYVSVPAPFYAPASPVRYVPSAPVETVPVASYAGYVPAQGVYAPSPILERYAPTVAAMPQPAAAPVQTAPLQAARWQTTTVQAAPMRAAPAVVPARFTETLPLDAEPEAVAVGGRRFRAIDETKVAELASRLKDAPRGPRASDISAPGLQVTTSEPFSIPTGTSGKPYYAESTPPAIEYHIPHIPQEEPLWCWAAAAQQAIGWVNNGRAPAQCAIVALAHGLDVQECCADRDGICARTGEIPAIAKLVEKFGGEARELATVPRDPQTIYDILRRGDTLLIRIRPAPHDEAVGIRHMIVVRGIEWLRLPNNQLQATLLYNDPLGAGERAVNFDEIEGFFEQALVVSRRR